MSDVTQQQAGQGNANPAAGSASQASGSSGDSGDQNQGQGQAAAASSQDGKAGAESGDSKGQQAAQKAELAPEKYEPFKLPESMVLNEATLEKFQALAKGYNLSQEKAQNLVSLGAEIVQKTLDDQAKQWTEVRDKWVKEIKSDPEFGGQRFTETVTRAKRALTKFGSEGLTKFLDSTGYGDNPDLIRMLAKIDRAIGEDSVIDGKPGQGSEKTAADTLYPNQGQ